MNPRHLPACQDWDYSLVPTGLVSSQHVYCILQFSSLSACLSLLSRLYFLFLPFSIPPSLLWDKVSHTPGWPPACFIVEAGISMSPKHPSVVFCVNLLCPQPWQPWTLSVTVRDVNGTARSQFCLRLLQEAPGFPWEAPVSRSCITAEPSRSRFPGPLVICWASGLFLVWAILEESGYERSLVSTCIEIFFSSWVNARRGLLGSRSEVRHTAFAQWVSCLMFPNNTCQLWACPQWCLTFLALVSVAVICTLLREGDVKQPCLFHSAIVGRLGRIFSSDICSWFKIFIYVYLYVYAHVCVVPTETRRWRWIPWSWSYS